MPRAAGIVALLLLHLPSVWLFSCTTNSVDCAALSDLYATCTSPSCLSNWRAAAQSGTPLNACTSLGGVACDATGRVNSLSLTSVGLAGTIPASVGNLTGLTFLSLSTNALQGSVPSSLSNLLALTQLSLSVNSLSGTFPSALCSLTRLTWLSLFLNPLITGSIPPCVGTLTGLQDLLLGVMGLSGTIPPSLGSLTALQQLGLHLNQLNGTIPSSLGNLGQLSLLWIYGNQLSGSLPPTFCTNAALKSCIVFSPTGGQSANFSSCVAPTCRAALDYCGMPACPQLHCAARNSLRVCSALSDLYFSTAGSGWTMNTGWLAAASLGSDFTGDGVDLCSFYGVSCNSTTGVLTALNLASNNLAGALPLSISTLTSLSSLVLSQNRLTGAIPPTMGSLSAASILSLWGNQLSGPLPDSLSTLGSLILLDVSNNSLSGPVPLSFCTLASTLGFGPFGSGCVLARARDSNAFTCPLPCPSLLAGGCSVLTCVNPPVPAPVPDLRKRNLEIGLPIALFFALVSFFGLRHLVVKRRLSRPTASCLDTVSHVFRLLFNALCCIPEEPLYDVFISYRREDMHIVDTIADKLLLAGFRVSMDRLGSLVGDGVDNSIFEAISQSRVFLPVISTALLRSLVKGDDSYWQQRKDYVLLEIVAAQLLLRSPASGRNRLHMIYPVVLGSESRDASNVLQWENFFKDPQFKAMAAQLPQVEPVATVAALKALFQTIGLEPLAGGGEGQARQLTVRDALYGSRSAGAAVDGLLALDCYILQGSSANVDAKIRLELAENIRKGLNKKRGPSAAHGLAPAAAKESGDGGGAGDSTSTSGGEP